MNLFPGILTQAVTLPPGRDRFAIKPAPTGSTLFAMTIGIVVVAFIAATVFTLRPGDNHIHMESD